jgi:opacity protein-like surface antigen
MRNLFYQAAGRGLAASLVSVTVALGLGLASAQAQVAAGSGPILTSLQDRYLTAGGSLTVSSDSGTRFGAVHSVTTGDDDEVQGFVGVGATVAHSQSGIASMRVEAEGRAANLVPESFVDGTGWTGDVNHYAAMANGYVDFNAPGAGSIYAGLGVGALLIDGTIARAGTSNKINDWAPAAQAMVGVAFPIAPNVGAKVGYRYMESGDFRIVSTTAGTSTQGEFAVRGQHNIDAGLMFKF